MPLLSLRIMATPTLAVTAMARPSHWAGGDCSMVLRMRSAVSWASASVVSGSITTNSSPPSRAGRSAWRTLWRRQLAVRTSTASPAAWPWLSLTCLKWSRSIISSASGRW